MSDNYERHHSHEHCWNQDGQPACGIPLEKHTQCCLCDLFAPVVVAVAPKEEGWEKNIKTGYAGEFKGYKVGDTLYIAVKHDCGCIPKERVEKVIEKMTLIEAVFPGQNSQEKLARKVYHNEVLQAVRSSLLSEDK